MENSTSTSAPVQAIDAEPKEKMSKKQVIGLVVMSLIALGGVLFGVYGMNSQNEKISELTVRATDAEGKVAELETNKITITDPESGTVEIVDSAPIVENQNPIIKSTGADVYELTHHTVSGGMTIAVKDGEYFACWASEDCSIQGLPNGIYKMANLYRGNGSTGENIAFIMEDGSVWYAPVFVDETGTAINYHSTARKVNVDGFVKDLVLINYCSDESKYCHGSTLFVMNDNSVVEFNESMLQ